MLPQVIESDRVIFFDVDDTLILWKPSFTIECAIKVNQRIFGVHTKHLQKIYDYHIMGFTIFVWSNSGYKWAAQVCRALGIQDKVTAMCKPHRVFDDAKNLSDTIGHGYIPMED